ncbi:MAG: hypothetical protein ACRDG3_05175, partial [Tepidiformaceae bacterium]
MATRPERNVKLVVAGAAACSTVVAVALGAQAQVPGRDEWLTATALLVIAMTARHYPLQIAFRRRMVTDAAPLFAAVLLLSAPLAAGVALVSIFVAELTARTATPIDGRQVLFNSCQAFLASAAAAGVYAAITAGRLPSPEISV